MSMRVKPAYIFFTIAVIAGVIFVASSILKNKPQSNTPNSERLKAALKSSVTSRIFNDFIPQDTSSSKNPGFTTSPEFRIGQYVITSPLPDSAQNIALYEFKTDFSDQYVTSTVAKLIGPSFSEKTQDGDLISFANDFGYARFNKRTGAFSASSLFMKLPFNVSNPRNLQDIKPQLTSFLLRDIGIIDETVTLTALYQRSDQEGVTYYEFHRNAEKLGIPILNPIGVLNVGEETSLTELKLGASQLEGAADPSIVYATDQPGKARQSEFNTMTVAVTNDGRILSIDSNIRPIEKISELSDRGLAIYDAKKALEELQRNGAYYNITIPVGEGYIDLSKVYRDNKFVSDEAHVTDVVLAYLEKPPTVSQKYLQPVYVIRGFAETETGVRVAFSQTIPALDQSSKKTSSLRSLWSAMSDNVLPVAFAQEEGDGVITLPCDDGSTGNCRIIRRRITPTPTTPATPTNIPPTVVPPTPNICILLTKDGAPIEQGVPLYVPGLGTIYYFPTALPNGPLAIPKGQKGVTTDRTFDKFQVALDNHFLSIAAERIINNPSLQYYFPTGSINTAITLNAIFSDVTIDLDTPIVMSSWIGTSSSYNVKVALYRLNNPTTNSLNVNQLAALPRLQNLSTTDISLTQLWLLKRNLRSSYGGAQLFSQYRLTDICEFASTVSPLMYFYPENEQVLQVDFIGDYVSYADPIKKNSIAFSADVTGNLNFNGLQRDRLHYEYVDIAFNRPKNGWVVKYDNAEEFVQGKLSKIGLSDRELHGLMQELRAGLTQVSRDENMFISIIPSQDIDKKLPIRINPAPAHSHRLHLYIESISQNDAVDMAKLSEPILPKIQRGGYYFIETGVYVK